MSSVKRFKLRLEYNGTPFCGFQRQENAPTIQEHVEKALEAFTGEPATLYVAGRTDAGVHARGQVAHVDLPAHLETDVIQRATNAHLRPNPISVVRVEEVPEDFHARFSAKRRYYLYRIINRPAPLTFDENLAWHVKYDLDEKAMAEGAKYLLGCHDFTTFRTVHCQAKSPVRTLDTLDVERVGEEILIRTNALSFLHHQVRNMVGTLALVGSGKWTPQDVGRALQAKDRRQGGPTAPSCGLYFMDVDYGE